MPISRLSTRPLLWRGWWGADMWDRAIERARYDSNEARKLIGTIGFYLRKEIPLPAELRGFLADALEEISKGGEPSRALLLKRKKGDRSIPPEVTETRLTQLYALRYAYGLSWNQCDIVCADAWDKDVSLVRRMRAKHRARMEDMDYALRTGLIPPMMFLATTDLVQKMRYLFPNA